MPDTPDILGGASPTSEDIKEVYARFGLAYYEAEVLHRGLCNLYSASHAPSTGPITQPRVEENLRAAFESTLGQLISKLKPILPAALLPALEHATERRNFLAHYFWYERAHLLTNLSGIEAMINELSEDTDLFSGLDVEVSRLIAPLNARFGLTQEHLDAALAEVLRGEPCKPLNQQRKPKKEETIVGVFNAPTASGKRGLVFQSEDGVLWQLCDVGLGWTAFDSVDPSWPPVKKFDAVLPARVNPRPPVSAPWTFDLQFGNRATLSVRLGKLPGEVLYKLTRQSS